MSALTTIEVIVGGYVAGIPLIFGLVKGFALDK